MTQIEHFKKCRESLKAQNTYPIYIGEDKYFIVLATNMQKKTIKRFGMIQPPDEFFEVNTGFNKQHTWLMPYD